MTDKILPFKDARYLREFGRQVGKLSNYFQDERAKKCKQVWEIIVDITKEAYAKEKRTTDWGKPQAYFGPDQPCPFCTGTVYAGDSHSVLYRGDPYHAFCLCLKLAAAQREQDDD